MENPAIALVLPPLLLVPAMGVLSRIRSTHPLGCELKRKTLHVGVGLTSLSFPLILTKPWMVVTALSMIACWMIAVRSVPVLRRRFGAVLHDAKRISHGELYFALAIAGLLLAAPANPVLFVIPVLILTISDAAAAVVGRAFPFGRLTGLARGKTLSGSAAFLSSAFLITLLALDHYTAMPLASCVIVAAVVANSTCIVEAASRRGLDNVLVPATAFCLLEAIV